MDYFEKNGFDTASHDGGQAETASDIICSSYDDEVDPLESVLTGISSGAIPISREKELELLAALENGTEEEVDNLVGSIVGTSSDTIYTSYEEEINPLTDASIMRENINEIKTNLLGEKVSSELLPTTDEQCFEQLVSRDVDHFRKVKADVEGGGKSISFNLYAFFFTSSWFAYRKLYAHAFIIAGLEVIFSVLALFMNSPSMTVDLLAGIACGLFANDVYVKVLNKRVQRYSALTSTDERIKFMRRHGGTNMGLAVVLMILVVALPTIIFFFKVIESVGIDFLQLLKLDKVYI